MYTGLTESILKWWAKDDLTKNSEAAIGGVLEGNVFLKISQNSQENTCARVSFLIKLRA